MTTTGLSPLYEPLVLLENAHCNRTCRMTHTQRGRAFQKGIQESKKYQIREQIG